MIKWLKSKYEAFRLQKYYLSIKELPMYNWITLSEENDIKQLSKTGTVCKRVQQVYEKLQDEIIDTFGVNQDFIKIKNKKKQIELLYCEQIRTGDLSTGWKIEMLELDIEDLQNRQIKSDLYESIIAIEKHLGFKINPKELTVFQFYKYSKTIANRLKHEVK